MLLAFNNCRYAQRRESSVSGFKLEPKDKTVYN